MRRKPDRDETPGSRSGLELELMRPSPPRGRSACGYTAQFTRKQEYRTRTMSGSRTPLVEFRHYTPYPDRHPKCKSGSHLGSTLKPGGAVLTLGVSRRSGSVAYIRVDASPNEVLTP